MDLSSPNPTTNSPLTPVLGDNVQDLLGVGALHVNPTAIITVNSIADVVDDLESGVTTLRDAINQANADAGEDMIVFDRSLFSTAQTITLSLGELDITHNLDIIAPRDTLTGGNLVTVSGNKASRVFEIESGATVTLSGLIEADGNVTNDDGGGIKNSGVLTLDSSIVRNDFAGRGGGIANSSDATMKVRNSTISRNSAYSSGGGGINNNGTLMVSNSTISSNFATNGGGINNSGIVEVSNSTISGNSTSFGGGGIYNSGAGSTVEVSNSTISGNSTPGGGGGIYNGMAAVGSLNGIPNDSNNSGGEISGDSIVVVRNSTLTDNAAGNGGGIYNGDAGILSVSNSTISDNRTYYGNGGPGGGIFNGGIYNRNYESIVDVRNSTISGNTSSGAGGGIFNGGGKTVEVRNSTLTDNKAGNNGGGGIYNFLGTLEVSNSTLGNNSATDASFGGGGGIFNYAGILEVSDSTLSGNTSAKNGGGILSSYGSNVEVSNSTFRDNSAAKNGGGIFNGNGENLNIGDSSNATITVNNSTLSGNTGGANGGGIFNNRTLTLVFSTLTLNQAANGSGVYNDLGSTSFPSSTNVRNTIIASNLNSEDGVNPNVSGTFNSNGYNLIGDSTGSTGFGVIGDIVGTSDNSIDPRLALLDFYGGSTQTIALLPDSPAIDAADPIVLDTDPTTDQRGLPRVSGVGSDIGAFEVQV